MKAKITISILLGLLTFSFIFNDTFIKTLPPYTINQNVFITSAMDCALDNDYVNMNALNLNLWHKYVHIFKRPNGTFVSDGWDWWNDTSGIDQVEAPINNYSGLITGRMSENNDHGFRTLYQRPKFERLLFGQRSDYQCESKNYIQDQDYRFYGYNYSPNSEWIFDETDNTVWGRDTRVKHCQPDPINSPLGAGYVDSGLVANNEQVNTGIGTRWEGDIIYNWYIKPSIRIDSAVAYNNENVKVCKIEVLDYEGNIIKTVDILAGYFKNAQNPYHGQYREDFFFPTGTNLTIPPVVDHQNKKNAFNPNGLDGTWPFTSRGESGTGQCKVDFRVYWYGNCNMWIDYVRVDNDAADQLFKGYFEGHDPNHPERTWLQDEVNLALQGPNNNVYRIYTEEFEFNNIPAFAYVNHKIDSLAQLQGKSMSLMVDLNYTAYNAHLQWSNPAPLGAQHVKKCLIEKVGLKELFGGPYSLIGSGQQVKYPDPTIYTSYIPITLYRTQGAGVLATPTSPSTYDTWLQNEFDKNDPFGF